MRIESVEAFPVKIKASEGLSAATFAYTHYQTVLVKVRCDGVEGWGEAMTRLDTKASAEMVRYLGSLVTGSNASDPGSAWETMWTALRVRGHTRGTDVEALSGIEIALFDCLGKLDRQPLSKLLSEGAGSRVPVYAGSLFESRGPLNEQALLARKMGLGGAKVKIGFGPERDLEMLQSVREVWPEALLVADANCAYDGDAALRACRLFKGLGLAWFEEPVMPDDWAAYRRLKDVGVRIGAGETWFKGDLEAAIKERLVNVVEPSVSRCGGVAVAAESARAASKAGIDFSPMTGMSSAVSLATSVHLAAAFPSVGVEFNPFPNPLQTELAGGIEKPSDGYLTVPDGPGLGIEVDEKFVNRNAM